MGWVTNYFWWPYKVLGEPRVGKFIWFSLWANVFFQPAMFKIKWRHVLKSALRKHNGKLLTLARFTLVCFGNRKWFGQVSNCIPVQITCDSAAVQFEQFILYGSNRTAFVPKSRRTFIFIYFLPHHNWITWVWSNSANCTAFCKPILTSITPSHSGLHERGVRNTQKSLQILHQCKLGQRSSEIWCVRFSSLWVETMQVGTPNAIYLTTLHPPAF